MQFKPFVRNKTNKQIPVSIVPMVQADAESTNLPPVWQTSWTSEYLTGDRFERYAARAGDELIALGAYEILDSSLVVHIVYMEAQPESNPTLDNGEPKYTGIGRLMIAYGIKLSIDNGFAGDVVLEAKTMPGWNKKTSKALESSTWRVGNQLVRMRPPAQIWAAAPQNPLFSFGKGGFLLLSAHFSELGFLHFGFDHITSHRQRKVVSPG